MNCLLWRVLFQDFTVVKVASFGSDGLLTGVGCESLPFVKSALRASWSLVHAQIPTVCFSISL